MAIKNTTLTQPLIFHSDQGIQYASQRFTNLLKSYNGLLTIYESERKLLGQCRGGILF